MQISESERPLGASQHNPAVLDSVKDCYRVLFVCRDKSVCSLIAEAILKRWADKDFRAFSAGIHPADQVHPLAVDLLKTQRLWGQNFQTKGCKEFLKPDAQRMNFIISIGEQRLNELPTQWPGNPRIIHWRISEPIADGKPVERALAFRRTFRELENRIKLFVLVYEREVAKKGAA